MAKILILANNDVGLYKFRRELIQELINRGNEVHISLPKGELIQPLINIGCSFIEAKVDRRGINPITDLKLLRFYLNVLRDLQPDLVITYTIKPNIYGGIACRIRNVRYTINITGLGTAFQKKGLFRKFIKHLYQFSIKHSDVVFFENEENLKLFVENKIITKEKACKLNGAGVNLDEYNFCQYPEDASNTRFLFIGRIMKEKGIDELLDAAVRIKEEYKNVEFDILGPMEENYDQLLNELQKRKVIKYHGYISDVKPFIRNASCFVLPSYHEGMANTLLECGAIGRPLITTNIPGCKEAVIDKKTGFLVKARDSNDLYIKLKHFIHLSYKEKVGMANLSRSYIEENFNKHEVVKMTLKRLFD